MQKLQRALDASSTVFHASCTDPSAIDLEMFEFWVNGFREEQFVLDRRKYLGQEGSDSAEEALLLLLYQVGACVFYLGAVWIACR